MTSSTQYLKKRGHSWYFVRAVPRDLQDKFGKTQIVEALGTRDLTEARRLRWERMEYWERRFAELTGPLRPDKAMPPRQIFSEHLEFLRTSGASVPSLNPNGLGADEEMTEFEIRQELLLQQAIAEHGEDEMGHPKAMSPAQEAQWDALQVYLKEKRGKNSSLIEKYGLTVSEATKRYLSRASRSKNGQTIRQHGATLRRLSEFVNDKPLVKLSKSDVGKFIGLLETFSSSWGKSPKDAERALVELEDRYAGKGSPLSDSTLNRHLLAIRSLWRWAQSSGEVEGTDPTEGLFRKTKSKTSKANTYLPFSSDELKQLFTGKLPSDHAILEVSLVALYSGMRLGEIVKLSWDDVRSEGGLLFFDIKEAKSVAGVRRVPVHKALSWLLARRDTAGWLWPSLVGNDLETAADRASKKFQYYKKVKGLTGRGKVFHSFRKTFISTLARAGVQEAEIAQIVGHEHNQITFSVYNPEGFPLDQCKRAMDQFEVVGLSASEIVQASLARALSR